MAIITLTTDFGEADHFVGVMKGVVLGIPAAPDRETKRQLIALQQLPELIRRTRELEKQVAELTAKLAS